MEEMFCGCWKFTGEGLKNWKPIKCEDMEGMFNTCKKFNNDLSNWDVRQVKDMQFMFEGCDKFTGEGLENWEPINCKYMKYMFDECDSLKNIPSWYK
jgi:surface protein